MADPAGHEINYRALAEIWQEKLLAATREALMAAYMPYSNFAVGAAVLMSDGAIYQGCNIENASFGLTVCAERVAVFNAISHGRMDIAAVMVLTRAAKLCKPCGACRQVIAEFSHADNPIIVISVSATGESVIEPITRLLPDSFTLL